MSGSTTDIDAWIESVGLESPDEIVDLYNSIDTGEGQGCWNVKHAANGSMIIKSPVGGESLVLPSGKAHDYAKREVEKYKSEPDMDMEGWRALMHAMRKD